MAAASGSGSPGSAAVSQHILQTATWPPWAKWGVVAAGSLLLLRGSGMGTYWYSQPIKETDFDNFLVQQGAPTGLKRPKKSRAAWQEAGERGEVSGPFETFLKTEPEAEEAEVAFDPRNPIDFSSFLKTALRQAEPGSAAQPFQQQQPVAALAGPMPEQARVAVMFGTEYTFSREIAEMLCAELKEDGKYWWVPS